MEESSFTNYNSFLLFYYPGIMDILSEFASNQEYGFVERAWHQPVMRTSVEPQSRKLYFHFDH